MVYQQNIDEIKLVILSLDGGVLDLNHLRYNYLKKIKNECGIEVSKETFLGNLGDYHTMYDNYEDANALDEMIEDDLYIYAKMKKTIKQDGIDELFHFLKQRKIKIAIFSTHKTKRAMQYLQLTKLMDKVDFVIGSDGPFDCLPKTGVLTQIMSQLGISPSNTLVVAPYPKLVEGAMGTYCNIIYMTDFVEGVDSIEPFVYRVIKNNLELVNVFLFSKYDSVELFSTALGMSKDMDLQTLKNVRDLLLREHADNPTVLALIKRTYRHYFILANGDQVVPPATVREEVIDHIDPILTNDETKIEDKQILLEETQECLTVDHVDGSSLDDVDSNQNQDLDDDINDEASTQINHEVGSLLSNTFATQAFDLNDLMDQINRASSTNTMVIEEVEESLEDNEVDAETMELKKHSLGRILRRLLVSFGIVISLIIIHLVVYLCFKEFILKNNLLYLYYQTVINYCSIVMGVLEGIITVIHSVFEIPDFTSLMQSDATFSTFYKTILWVCSFSTILVFFIKSIIYKIINK